VMLRKGETVTVIWLLAFRDTDSASRFAAVYRKVLDRMHGHPAAHRVELKGKAVLVVIGDAAAHFDRLGPALWKASTITAPAPTITPGGPSLQAGAPSFPSAPLRRLAAVR
jgi:hypothetical protein